VLAGFVLAVAQLAAVPADWFGVTAASAQTCGTGRPEASLADQVDGSARHARVWRLYQAYFLRQPDTAGFQYWISQSQAGVSLQDLSYAFAQSQEFRLRYGAVSNERFLDLVYQNVLCRRPDANGRAYWVNKLGSGEVNRGELMVYFSESTEYVRITGTRWSVFGDYSSTSKATDGFAIRSIPGGQMVEADYGRVNLKTAPERCAIASINANWLTPKDGINPNPIGFAVIDGRQVAGSYNRDDRGVIGERYRPNGPDQERTWTYQGSFNLNSNLAAKNGAVLESWRAWQPAATPRLDNPAEWRWAAAGIPLIVNRQVWSDFYKIPTNDYTHYTTRHSFFGFDKDTNTAYFGSTTAMTSRQLIDWAQGQGWDDLVKFDGGGSVEFNVGGQVKVAGTGRDIPVWLGIGC